MTTITALPTPPSRDDPANFASRGDAFMAALSDFVTETNTVAGEVNTNASTATTKASEASTSASTATTKASEASTSAGTATTKASEAAAYASAAAAAAAALVATSTTSLAIGTGSKTFTIQSGKQFAAGQFVVAASDANPANYMHGQVTSYGGTSLVLNVTDVGGSGTKADWTILVSGTQGPAGTGITAQTTGFTVTGGTTPKTLTVDDDLTASAVAKKATAQTFTAAQRGGITTLTDAATIALDLSLNNAYVVQLGGNRTLGAPTNVVANQCGSITVLQDKTGSRTLAYAWPYVWAGGTAGTLSTAGGTEDQLVYEVRSYNSGTVTITIATPGVVTFNSHGFYHGQRIQITTTGALPTGLTASTTYYVEVIDANSFYLCTSLANVAAGTRIATSGSQSGTHTLTGMTIRLALNKGFA